MSETEQTKRRPLPYTVVLAYLTPDELPSGAPDSPLVVTTDPPAVFIRGEGQWVPVASVEGDIPAPTLVNASETEAGVAEIATQAEVDAGADPYRIVTPVRLAGRTATETRAGLLELATAEEAAAGADATRAVHPAGLKTTLTPGAWVAPTLLGGWVNFGGGAEVAGYRKNPFGGVELKGLLRDGSTTNGTALFTLPLGHRPAAQRNFPVVQGGNVSARLVVDPDGTVRIQGVTSNAYLTLDGIGFGV